MHYPDVFVVDRVRLFTSRFVSLEVGVALGLLLKAFSCVVLFFEPPLTNYSTA